MALGTTKQSERNCRALRKGIGIQNKQRKRVRPGVLGQRKQAAAGMHCTICADGQEFRIGIDTGLVRHNMAYSRTSQTCMRPILSKRPATQSCKRNTTNR